MSAIFHRGSTSTRDYTPTADVAAGTVVDIDGKPCVVHHDIAANQLGGLAVQAGQTAYRVDLAPGQAYADGDAVLVDPATGLAGAAGLHFGYAEGAANQATGDTYVVASHAGILP